LSANLLFFGAGPAWLASAAAAAGQGVVVLVVDNPAVGGQIWRAELNQHKHPAPKSFLAAIDSGRVNVINGASINGAVGRSAFAESPGGQLEIEFDKLIVATGARERFLPFPGWTLPGVMGAGGLQAMVKGGLNVAGKRVVIAGTGPLLIAVAEYLKRKGANVLAMVEQVPAAEVNRFAFRLMTSPGKFAQAIKLRAALIGIPYLTNSWITSTSGDGRLHRVDMNANGMHRSFECDYLACGFHLVPNSEVARLVGCELDSGFVRVDDHQQTSVEHVFCAGEPTGIAGIESALVEGKIAGLAAAGHRDAARKLFSKRDSARAFGVAMDNAFALRDELRHLADDETFVCRCEDVTFGRLKQFANFREAKLQTRCGMGPCQGRVCGAATQFLFGWEPSSVRPPIFPVKMEHL
jgi:NADPH-dependent 2,4-dienoyl-CoA reductase/sulfur reductase-like enzyme